MLDGAGGGGGAAKPDAGFTDARRKFASPQAGAADAKSTATTTADVTRRLDRWQLQPSDPGRRRLGMGPQNEYDFVLRDFVVFFDGLVFDEPDELGPDEPDPTWGWAAGEEDEPPRHAPTFPTEADRWLGRLAVTT